MIEKMKYIKTLLLNEWKNKTRKMFLEIENNLIIELRRMLNDIGVICLWIFAKHE